MNSPNLIVITGGPGCGKTTLLEELKRRGYPIVAEVAREMIQEQVRLGGQALPWADRELYTQLMLQRSIDSFQQHMSAVRPTFFDRGIPDTLGYARLIGLPDASIKKACLQHRYASPVFWTPPWREIYRTDNERKQDFDEAETTANLIAAVYEECGYEVLELPKIDPASRADFIVAQLTRRANTLNS